MGYKTAIRPEALSVWVVYVRVAIIGKNEHSLFTCSCVDIRPLATFRIRTLWYETFALRYGIYLRRSPKIVFQGHLQDTYHFNSRFSASAGLKDITTHTTGQLAGFDQGLNLRPNDTSASYAQGELSCWAKQQSGKPFRPRPGSSC